MAKFEKEYYDDESNNSEVRAYIVLDARGNKMRFHSESEARKYYYQLQQAEDQRKVVEQNAQMLENQRRMNARPQVTHQILDPAYREWLQFQKDTNPAFKQWKIEKEHEASIAKLQRQKEEIQRETEAAKTELERLKAEKDRQTAENTRRVYVQNQQAHTQKQKVDRNAGGGCFITFFSVLLILLGLAAILYAIDYWMGGDIADWLQYTLRDISVLDL